MTQSQKPFLTWRSHPLRTPGTTSDERLVTLEKRCQKLEDDIEDAHGRISDLESDLGAVAAILKRTTYKAGRYAQWDTEP